MSRRGWGLQHVLASRRRLLVAVAVVASLAVVPFTTTASLTRLVFTGFVFVILGVSWNLLAGYAGQISLGHAAFFGIGAFVSAWLTHPVRAGLPEWLAAPVVASLFVAAIAAGFLALITGPIVFRLTGHYFAIGTLAVAVLIQLLLEDRVQLSGGAGAGFNVNSPLSQDALYLIALLAALGSLLLAYRIVHSRAGLGMRAVHGDEAAASSLGVNPFAYKLFAFVVAGAMAGMAGGLWAQVSFTISPAATLGIEWMIEILVVVILGGMGTMLGPVLGAGLFLLIDQVLGQVIGELSTTLEGVLIIGFVLFAPRGLWGIVADRFDERPPAHAGEDAVRVETET